MYKRICIKLNVGIIIIITMFVVLVLSSCCFRGVRIVCIGKPVSRLLLKKFCVCVLASVTSVIYNHVERMDHRVTY